jgi:hypothetical protein
MCTDSLLMLTLLLVLLNGMAVTRNVKDLENLFPSERQTEYGKKALTSTGGPMNPQDRQTGLH